MIDKRFSCDHRKDGVSWKVRLMQENIGQAALCSCMSVGLYQRSKLSIFSHADINGSKMPCVPAERLPAYVSELHRDNCFNAEEEYEVSVPPPSLHLPPLTLLATCISNTWQYHQLTTVDVDTTFACNYHHMFSCAVQSIKDRDPEFSKHAASQDCNETKNRYINILPREFNHRTHTRSYCACFNI